MTGVFQGLLLFSLLACDTLIAYRVRWHRPGRTAPPPVEPADETPIVPSSALPAREGA